MSFFSGIKQNPIQFKNFKAKTPLFFKDLHLMGGVFIVNAKAAQNLLPQGYKAAKLLPKRAFLAVHCMEYRESDIGAYNEVSLSILVESPGHIIPSIVRNTVDVLTQNHHAYIEDLPVTTEIARCGGVEVLNFPKYLAEISFRETATHRICTLRDKKSLQLILEFDCKKMGVVRARSRHKLDVVRIHTHSGFKNPACRGRLEVNLKERGKSFFLPQATLRFGTHAISEKYKALQPSLVLQTVYAPRCEAILYEA